VSEKNYAGEEWRRPYLTVSQFPRMGEHVRHEVWARLSTGSRTYQFVCDVDSAEADAEWLRQVSKYCLRMAKDLEYTAKKVAP